MKCRGRIYGPPLESCVVCTERTPTGPSLGVGDDDDYDDDDDDDADDDDDDAAGGDATAAEAGGGVRALPAAFELAGPAGGAK